MVIPYHSIDCKIAIYIIVIDAFCSASILRVVNTHIHKTSKRFLLRPRGQWTSSECYQRQEKGSVVCKVQ
ncbi:hypothetical protein BD408DRAFT_415018 [Parasitella parasitica]|nr:hypothetical protein BD408DRAFT_415018 [Parasitella parasitica]